MVALLFSQIFEKNHTFRVWGKKETEQIVYGAFLAENIMWSINWEKETVCHTNVFDLRYKRSQMRYQKSKDKSIHFNLLTVTA